MQGSSMQIMHFMKAMTRNILSMRALRVYA